MRSNMSGVGFYNSEPRNFNRGFGRGNLRSYQSSQPPPSPPPPRKGDVFIDAGQLAVEYLVSRGLLSSDVIPGKSQDKETSNSLDSRGSPNYQDMKISRSYSRDSKKWNRENGREKSSSPQTMEVDDKYPKDTSKEGNSDVCISLTMESAKKDDEELLKSVDESKVEKMRGDESHIQHSESNDDSSAKEETDMTKVDCVVADNRMKIEPLSTSKELNTSHSAKYDNVSAFSGFKSSSDIPISNFSDQLKPMESLPLTEKGFYHKQESSDFPEIKKDGNEKRAFEGDSMTEGVKKPKQWLSVGQSKEYLQLSNLNEKKSISPEKRDAAIFKEPSDPESFHNMSLPQQGGVESMDQREEKQLFESSYKLFDLNLMEASDVHETHGATTLLYSSLSAPMKQQIDIDPSNSCSFISEYSDAGSMRKDVEIIDLESPTTEQGEGAKFSTKSEEAGITTTENIGDNQQHTNDNPDGQDGYGFMISELLGNDVPHCSTVQPDSNSLQADMGLHHGENMFTEDDPIYMSLGEIPLTGLLHGWEQPTQEKNPFEL